MCWLSFLPSVKGRKGWGTVSSPRLQGQIEN